MFVEEKTQGEPAKVLDETSTLLLKAAALIEKFGLAKWIQADSEGRFCAVGAIVKAAGGIPYGESMDDWREGRGIETGGDACKLAVFRMEDALRPIAPSQTDPVASWNNVEERTQAEVVSKLRAVALGL